MYSKIGKFGVGFKAVFTYTKTPRLFSGDYNFEVIDLVVPNEIKSIGHDDKTLMIFPFNSDIKSRELAFKEIKQGLEKLKDNTLLFLNSISKIEYSKILFGKMNCDNEFFKNGIIAKSAYDK